MPGLALEIRRLVEPEIGAGRVKLAAAEDRLEIGP
jgi:hypothetical protein